MRFSGQRLLAFLLPALLWGCATGGILNKDWDSDQLDRVRTVSLFPREAMALGQALMAVISDKLGEGGVKVQAARWEALATPLSPGLPPRIHPDDLARSCDRCGEPLLALHIQHAHIEARDGAEQDVLLQGELVLYEPQRGGWVWKRSLNIQERFPAALSVDELARRLVEGVDDGPALLSNLPLKQ